MDEFSPTDAHRAAREARHQAEERREKTPTAAKVLLLHAAELEAVRDKILDRLPEQVRKAYP